MATTERKTDLDRLLELEQTEIPRVRDALRAWADDAHLALICIAWRPRLSVCGSRWQT
jgi:hypothetical protein